MSLPASHTLLKNRFKCAKIFISNTNSFLKIIRRFIKTALTYKYQKSFDEEYLIIHHEAGPLSLVHDPVMAWQLL